jgi:hypothetical protein
MPKTAFFSFLLIGIFANFSYGVVTYSSTPRTFTSICNSTGLTDWAVDAQDLRLIARESTTSPTLPCRFTFANLPTSASASVQVIFVSVIFLGAIPFFVNVFRNK